MPTKCRKNVNELPTKSSEQVSIGKDSIGKDSIDKSSIDKSSIEKVEDRESIDNRGIWGKEGKREEGTKRDKLSTILLS